MCARIRQGSIGVGRWLRGSTTERSARCVVNTVGEQVRWTEDAGTEGKVEEGE